MPYYKSPNNKVHFIEDAGSEYMLPAGSIEITENEADEITNPAPTVSELKSQKLNDFARYSEAEISSISAGYPASEVLSWPKQETEARVFTANASAATPLLDALATARGITKADLASRVIAKADMFALISGSIIGKRQGLEDAIAALPVDATPEQVAAIKW